MGESKLSEKNVTFAFGHAVGAGVQELLAGGSIEQAIWEAFLAWDVELFDVDNKYQKSFAWAIHALHKFLPYCRQILKTYEVANFNGKPAKELSFRIRGPNNYYYRGHIDIVLKHRMTGQLLVVELKTTGKKTILESDYANSSQGLSYSLVLDNISAGNSAYHVWYVIYKTEDEDFEFFPYQKSMLDKANWIKGVVADFKQVESYKQDNFYPQYDTSCTQYWRPCKYFDLCGMVQGMIASARELEERVQKELAMKYTFEFTLEDIINQQLKGN
jgi:hypothetical protein